TVGAGTGGGQGRLAVSPTALSFGQKTVGSRTKLTIQVSNTGSGPLDVTVGSLAAPFSVTSGGGRFTLPAGQRRTVEVQFAPTVRRTSPPFTGRLTISASSGTPASVAVSVSGTAR